MITVPTTAKNLVVVLFSNAQGGATDNLAVAECQLTLGTEIIDWVEEPFEVQLAKCQRFYCKTFAYGTVPSQTGGLGNAERTGVAIAGAVATSSALKYKFPVTMWKTPGVITFYNPSAGNAFARNVARSRRQCVSGALGKRITHSRDCQN